MQFDNHNPTGPQGPANHNPKRQRGNKLHAPTDSLAYASGYDWDAYVSGCDWGADASGCDWDAYASESLFSVHPSLTRRVTTGRLVQQGITSWRVMLSAWRVMLLVFAMLVCSSPIHSQVSAAQPPAASEDEPDELVKLLRQTQGRIVKIYGAGGLKGLESYQSGFFISNDGMVLTSWSTVLDVDKPRIVTFDGKKWEGTLVGVDPVTELAILKIDGAGFPFCELNYLDAIPVGLRVFGVTNLFGIASGNEEASVQKGVVMAHYSLDAKRGRIKSPYRGPIYVLDVLTNNPGATGGALFDLKGNLVGVIGKELRDESSGIWLNYALPMSVVAESVNGIVTGKPKNASDEMKAADRPHELSNLGLTLIPDVLAKTPAYVDQVTKDSFAERSGLKSNDLIIQVNRQRIDSRKGFEAILKTIDRADPLKLLVQRGNQLLTIEIRP